MLQKLYISNYAIIDELEITFSSTLNIITGETGAGKSILMGALGLVLGQRADSSTLRNKEKKCIVEGIFLIEESNLLNQFFTKNELDFSTEIVIRREIAPNGKSRAFINDTPVTLVQLQTLTLLLVDLHQQFDTLTLTENDFQREVLDALAGNDALLHTYQSVFTKWTDAKNHLDKLLLEKQQAAKEWDYNQFLFNELAEADLKENELEQLDEELKMLSHAEEIKSALAQACAALNEGEQPIVQQLKTLVLQLQHFSNYHTALPTISERLLSAQIELKDIADEIESLNEHINVDALRIDFINEKMALGYKLLKKHGVQTTNELIEIKNQLSQKLQHVLNIDAAIEASEKESNHLLNEAQSLAEKLSTERKRQIKPFEQKVNALLVQVGMPNALIKVDLKNYDALPNEVALRKDGKDAIEFLFDANKSNRFEPLRKVASGGELSRLMLSIKSLVASSVAMPTLIFDEIDTGISGEAARQVGIIMNELSKKHQVISITHQPQIAAKAHTHFYVYKKEVNGEIKTLIKQLNETEKIETIAKMLSGEKLSDTSLKIAKEMMAE